MNRKTLVLALTAVLLAGFPAGAQEPPKLRPFEDALKRRERILGGRPGKGGLPAGGLERRSDVLRRATRPPPPTPPPATKAARVVGKPAEKKEDDKARPKDERHLQPRPPPPPPVAAAGRIDFDKADIRDVAKFISEITGKNIILSDKARGGKLTIFSPAPVSRAEAYQAFLAALEVNNLTVVPAGKFLKIVPQRDAKEMPVDTFFDPKRTPDDDRMVTAIIHVKNGDAKEINNVVGQLKNKNGFNLVYAPTNAIIIADVAANIRRLMRIIKTLDVPVGTRDRVWVIKVEHATASELVEKVNQIFGEKAGAPKPGAPVPPRPPRPPAPGAPAPEVPAVVGEAIEPETLKVTKMIADDRTNQVILVANEPTYLRVLALLARLDVKLPHDEGRVHVYYLQNADAESLATVLSNLVSGAAATRRSTGAASTRPGTPARPTGASSTSAAAAAGVLFEGEVKVSADKSTNSLVIVASGKDFDRLKRVIEKLDIRRRQVFVEAVIMELSMTKSRTLGLAFNVGSAIDVGGEKVPIFGGTTFGKLSSVFLDPSVLTGLAVGVRGPSIEGSSGLLGGLPGGTTTGTGIGIGLSLPSFGVILRALQATNDVNVLSTPHILASDNEEAEIIVGQNVPFVSGGFGGFGGFPAFAGVGGIGAVPGVGGIGGIGGLPLGGFGFPGALSIQRQDVALTLKITPQINASDYVKIKVEQEVQDLAGDDPIRGPTTTKRRAKTTVIVKDQQTVVLGGLIRDNYTEDINKVPILGDVPILGYFFRDTVKRVEKRNLLLFLTPYIIKDASDFRRIFKQKMRERQEFLERFASETKEYRATIDYTKRHGILEEINQQVQQLEKRELEEQKVLEEEKKRAAKEKLLEVVQGSEVRPEKPQKRRSLELVPPERVPVRGEPKKAVPGKKPAPPAPAVEEPVRDE